MEDWCGGQGWGSFRVSVGVARVKVETLVPVLFFRRPAAVVREEAQYHSAEEAVLQEVESKRIGMYSGDIEIC